MSTTAKPTGANAPDRNNIVIEQQLEDKPGPNQIVLKGKIQECSDCQRGPCQSTTDRCKACKCQGKTSGCSGAATAIANPEAFIINAIRKKTQDFDPGSEECRSKKFNANQQSKIYFEDQFERVTKTCPQALRYIKTFSKIVTETAKNRVNHVCNAKTGAQARLDCCRQTGSTNPTETLCGEFWGGSLNKLNKTCDNIMSEYCDKNPSDKSCKCLKSKMAKPACTDPECVGDSEAYKNNNMRIDIDKGCLGTFISCTNVAQVKQVQRSQIKLNLDASCKDFRSKATQTQKEDETVNPDGTKKNNPPYTPGTSSAAPVYKQTNNFLINNFWGIPIWAWFVIVACIVIGIVIAFLVAFYFIKKRKRMMQLQQNL